MNGTKNLDKKSARSEGKSLNLLAKVKFCILENSSMSNCIYHRHRAVFEFLPTETLKVIRVSNNIVLWL